MRQGPRLHCFLLVPGPGRGGGRCSQHERVSGMGGGSVLSSGFPGPPHLGHLTSLDCSSDSSREPVCISDSFLKGGRPSTRKSQSFSREGLSLLRRHSAHYSTEILPWDADTLRVREFPGPARWESSPEARAGVKQR